MNNLLALVKQMNLIRILEALGSGTSIRKLAAKQKSGQTASIDNKTASNTSTRPFSEIIKEASHKYGVAEDVINAVIQQESSFNPTAVSSCGAMGLMQLMPSTAESLGVENAYNAEQNIMGGTFYLKQKLDEFDGNLPLALAAYNAGSGAVRKHGGIPPYKETQAYVNKIMKSVDHWA
ncbi:MAG: lytic transglycosylase domain-containing protein [Firmicutes bacterium HGW-Firmicutes-15]|nr:MAG: lytic transglycosylase domain-containing protein [Firmicutes bacterium HGW-Firmicutes-15]